MHVDSTIHWIQIKYVAFTYIRKLWFWDLLDSPSSCTMKIISVSFNVSRMSCRLLEPSFVFLWDRVNITLLSGTRFILISCTRMSNARETERFTDCICWQNPVQSGVVAAYTIISSPRPGRSSKVDDFRKSGSNLMQYATKHVDNQPYPTTETTVVGLRGTAGSF